MRVTLVNPPIDGVLANGGVGPVTEHLFYNSAPLGILYVAAALEAAGHTVTVVDAAAERLDVGRTVARLIGTRPGLIALGATTVAFETARSLAARLRGALPGVPIVLGGYHLSNAPEEAMAGGEFDAGVIHDAEHTMVELCGRVAEGLPLEGLAGAIVAGVRGPERAQPRDLDSLPMPARHLLAPDLYRALPLDERGLPKFTMITSRGCPHACVFCQEAQTGYRTLSAAAIADEMEVLVRDYGVRDIAFVDSLFCVSRRRVLGICDELIRRGLPQRVSWTCTARVDTADREVLTRMKEAGCWRVRMGLESGSDRVLDFISKGITCARIEDVVGVADEVGLRPKAFFMVGHFPDTHATIQETIAFAKRLPLHDITVQINTLLPHTPQMDVWEQEGRRWGRVVEQSTDRASAWEPNFVPWGLEPEDLIRYHRKLYREFYLRPEVVARHVGAIRSVRDVSKYASGARIFGLLFFNRGAG